MYDINESFTSRNKHSVDRYSLTKTDIKINNEHEFLKIRWSYQSNNMLNLQRLDIKKRLKIKTAQNISAAEAKVNERNSWMNEDEVKSSLHIVFLNEVIKDNYSCKQEDVNKETQSWHIHVKIKSLLE